MNKIITGIVTTLAGVLIASAVFVLGFAPKEVTPPSGAVAGPDSYFPVETHQGIASYFYSGGFSVATTTPCSFKTPGATTTLQSFTAYFTTGTTSATTVEFTTGTAMQATTTALGGKMALAANAIGAFVASTTNSEATRLLSPNTWIQVSMVGGGGTVSPVGKCQAVLRGVN